MSTVTLQPSEHPKTALHHTVTRYPSNALVVTPSNSDVFDQPVMVQVGSSGTVTVTPFGGQPDLQYDLLKNEFVPVLCIAVKSTGTSATPIRVYW